MCLKAAALIAVCLGYLPSPGSSVTVTDRCTSVFSKKIQNAAKACASENNVTWRVK